MRKKHLTDIAKNFAKYILTAHHKDDLLESTLMKIIKGSPFENFPGLIETNSYSDLIFFKPLIHYSKEDLIKYAKEKIPRLGMTNPTITTSILEIGFVTLSFLY